MEDTVATDSIFTDYGGVTKVIAHDFGRGVLPLNVSGTKPTLFVLYTEGSPELPWAYTIVSIFTYIGWSYSHTVLPLK